MSSEEDYLYSMTDNRKNNNKVNVTVGGSKFKITIDTGVACVAAGQFLEGEGKDRLPGFLMFFNTAPFLKLLRQPIRREIINTLLNSIKLN